MSTVLASSSGHFVQLAGSLGQRKLPRTTPRFTLFGLGIMTLAKRFDLISMQKLVLCGVRQTENVYDLLIIVIYIQYFHPTPPL